MKPAGFVQVGPGFLKLGPTYRHPVFGLICTRRLRRRGGSRSLGGLLSKRVFRRCRGLLLLRRVPVPGRVRQELVPLGQVRAQPGPVLPGPGRGRQLGQVLGQRVLGRLPVLVPVP